MVPHAESCIPHDAMNRYRQIVSLRLDRNIGREACLERLNATAVEHGTCEAGLSVVQVGACG